jgi:hypothetical protein
LSYFTQNRRALQPNVMFLSRAKRLFAANVKLSFATSRVLAQPLPGAV